MKTNVHLWHYLDEFFSKWKMFQMNVVGKTNAHILCSVTASGSRSETPWKFWNVVMEGDGKDQLDWSCEKWRLLRVKEQRNILHDIRKRKANWIGHILRRNCLVQRVIEGKKQGGIEVTGRKGRRRRKLLDDLKERRGYSHLKEEALDRTMWTARFGRSFGPVVRQTAKWMNFYSENRSVYATNWKNMVQPHRPQIT